ncbi:AroM family protein [Microvirga alba]|uniref:AroM family protein n=1 Tax=Microvirga alba TaxID=2791025 RepID=A0A931FSD6_9HYPH|nr:AroM family protein [Microvirga alba]MBF9235493.1 AroM family protein [Microvirga alba]
MSRPTIGLITLGQGPRPEYERLHGALFGELGIDVRLVSRHVLDGLSPDQIDALEARDGEPAINSNLHGDGPTPSPLGRGWTTKWISRSKLVPLIQAAIDAFERDDGVDVTLCCVAEEFPEACFRSQRPFVLPSAIMMSYPQVLAATRPDATIGLVVYGDRQREQQKAGFAAKTWARDLRTVFSGNGRNLPASIAEIKRERPDLVLVWAYAAGFAPNEPPGQLAELSVELGAPLIVPAVAAVTFIRNLLSPPISGIRACANSPDLG